MQSNDDEGIEQVEADGWYNEQVHRGDIWRVITEESEPSLTGRSTSLDHVFGDARLRDIKPELEQFAVDTRRTPKADSPCSSAGSARGGPSRSAAALPVEAISSASSNKSRPDATARWSQVGRS